MAARVLIVDYGVGNLYSAQRAVEVSGCSNVLVSRNPDDIKNADKVILPGVGAFEDGMRGLREYQLVEPLLEVARAGIPILGICLGMQMLASTSDEFGSHKGLDLIPGDVKAIPRQTTEGGPLKVPFIGWRSISIENAASASQSCLHQLGNRAVYLVHSFHMVPNDSKHLLASYQYGGNRITAAIRRDNITGVQFHPEKSAAGGLEIIRAFITHDSFN